MAAVAKAVAKGNRGEVTQQREKAISRKPL
jgi:hypothetical protein